jgi:hypothetical protein
MSECNNIVDVSALDECSEVDNDSYLIVQSINSVCRAKISDLVLGAENVDFYPELIDIANKLDTILSILEPNSGKWDNTSEVVAASSNIWNSYTDSDIPNIADDIKDNIDDWNSTTSTVNANAGDWDATTTAVALSASRWNNTASTFETNGANWEKAYTISLTVENAAAEAIEIIDSAYSSNMLSVYMTVNSLSDTW